MVLVLNPSSQSQPSAGSWSETQPRDANGKWNTILIAAILPFAYLPLPFYLWVKCRLCCPSCLLASCGQTAKRSSKHFCNYIWLLMGITQFIGDFTINLIPEFVASKISTFIARNSIILPSERSYVSSWLNAGRAKSSLNS